MKRYPLIFLSFLALSCSSCAFLPSIGGGTGESSSSAATPAQGDGTTVTAEEFDNLFNHYGLLSIKDRYLLSMSMVFGDYSYAYHFNDGIDIDHGDFNRNYAYATHTGADDYEYRLKYRSNGDNTYKEYLYIYDLDGPADILQNDQWTYDDLFDLSYLQVGLQFSMFEYTTGAKWYELKEKYEFKGAFLGKEVDMSINPMTVVFENGRFKQAFGTMHTKQFRDITFNLDVYYDNLPELEEVTVNYRDRQFYLTQIVGIDDESGGRINVETNTAVERYRLFSSVEYTFFADKTYQSKSYVADAPVGENRLEYVHGTTEKRFVDGKYCFSAFPKYIKNQAEGHTEASPSAEINAWYDEETKRLYVPTDTIMAVSGTGYRAVYVLAENDRQTWKISYYPFGNEEGETEYKEQAWWRKEQFLLGRFDSPTLVSPSQHLNDALLQTSVADAYIEFYYQNRYFFDMSYDGYDPETLELYPNSHQNYGCVDEIAPGATFTCNCISFDDYEDFSQFDMEIVDNNLVFVDENTIERHNEYAYAKDPETNRWLYEEVVWQFHRSL